MAVYEIKSMSVVSLFKVFPIVFAMFGAVIGIFTFFVFPAEVAAGLGFGARILSWLVFVVLYTAIMSVGIAVVVWIYNFIVKKIGSGVVVNLEQQQIEG